MILSAVRDELAVSWDGADLLTVLPDSERDVVTGLMDGDFVTNLREAGFTVIVNDRIVEARLLEHPGHRDQKVHGRRGSGGDRSAQIAELDAELRTIRGAERIVAIDSKTGKVKLDKGGAGNSVEMTLADDVALRGTIASHNHPLGWEEPEGTLGRNGSGPSQQDLMTAWRAGPDEMRVVGPTQTFSVKKGTDATWGQVTEIRSATWPGQPGKPGPGQMRASLMEQKRQLDLGDIDSRVRTDFMADLDSGKKTIPQAESMHHEEVLRRAGEEFGWEVTVTREPGYREPITVFPKHNPDAPGAGQGWDFINNRTPEPFDEATLARELIATAVRLMEHPGHGSEKVHGRKGTSGVDVSGTQLRNISAKTRAKMGARATAIGLPTVDQQVADITDRFNRASPEVKKAGMEWYEDAHNQAQLAGEVTGYGLEKSAAVMAVNSPATHWDCNRARALETMGIIKGDKPFDIDAATAAKLRPPIKPGSYKPSELNASQVAYAHPNLKRKALSDKYFTEGVTDPKAYKGYSKFHEKNIAAGIEVLRGADIDAAVGGTKVRNFYNNIQDPRSGGVTVDDWAYRAAIPDMKVSVRYTDPKTGESRVYDGPAIDAPYGSLSGMMQQSPKAKGENYEAGLYPITAEAYSIAAKNAGILPSQMQAITWIQIREVDKGAR